MNIAQATGTTDRRSSHIAGILLVPIQEGPAVFEFGNMEQGRQDGGATETFELLKLFGMLVIH
jgi:hypothetical protein